jgi:hypothetical protein
VEQIIPDSDEHDFNSVSGCASADHPSITADPPSADVAVSMQEEAQIDWWSMLIREFLKSIWLQTWRTGLYLGEMR